MDWYLLLVSDIFQNYTSRLVEHTLDDARRGHLRSYSGDRAGARLRFRQRLP